MAAPGAPRQKPAPGVAIDHVAIGRITIDRARDPNLADSGAVPIEAMRRAYVEDMTGDVDWRRQFERIWRPIESLLASARANTGGTSRGAGT